MADRNLELQIRISAQLNELKGALNQVQGDLDKLGKTGGKTGKALAGGMNQAGQAMRTAARFVTGLVAAFAGIQGAKGFIQLADQAAILSARLRIVSSTSEEATRAGEQLFQVAQRTGTGLQETTDLYVRLAQATKELGLSQDTTLQTTETINKALQLSGVSAEAASAAVIQLGQGLASGELRGDELRSVLEQAPRLAQALAAGMGKSIGELRKLGEQGAITAEAVISALANQTDTINAEFAQLPDTVGRATTRISNSMLRVVDEINNASGATASLSSVLNDVSAWLDSGALTEGVVSFSAVWTTAFQQIGADIAETIDLLENALPEAFDAAGGDLGTFLVDAFRNLPANIRAFVQVAAVEFAAFLDRIAIRARGLRDELAAIFNDDTQEQAAARTEAALKRSDKARQETINTILAERDANIEKGKEAVAALKAERAERERIARTTPAAPAGAAKTKAPLGAADSLALAKDSTARELAELERAFDLAQISTEQYFARRRALQEQAYSQEIAIQQAALAKLKSDDEQGRSRILTQIAILERDRDQVARESAAAAADRARDFSDELVDLQVRSLTAAGQVTEARKLELQQEFRDLLARLKADANEAGIALVNSLIQSETAKARLDEIGEAVDQAISQFNIAQQNAANAVQAGTQSSIQAQATIQQTGQASLKTLQAMRAELELLANQGVKGAAEALAELDAAMMNIADQSAVGVEAAIRRLRTELAQMEQEWQGDAIMSLRDNLADMFASIADGSKSASEALKDFVKGFVADMARMAAEALATQAVLAMFGGGGGGGGGLLSGLLHTGGIAGVGGGTRRVPAMTFAGAARFHDGGMPGLRPDEVPAILQQGEEVLARDDPRNALNGGGNGGVTVNQTIVTPNADSFNRSRMQSLFEAQREADAAFRRNR